MRSTTITRGHSAVSEESGWTYYYKLEHIDTYGISTFHTVSLTLAAGTTAGSASGGGCFISSVTNNN